MRKLGFAGLLLLAALVGCSDSGKGPGSNNVPQLIDASLHNTTGGMGYFYGQAQGGFESIVGVPYTDLSCKNCHASGTDCTSCHTTAEGGKGTTTDAGCLAPCHSRQNAERNPAYGFTDVHRTAGMICADCHTAEDVHGDGTAHNSMLEPGAILAQCENDACHGASNPPDHSANATVQFLHLPKVGCAACHVRSVVSCYNCHFESEVVLKQKIANRQIKDWKFLVNDQRTGKVGLANLMTLSYAGKTFAVVAPFYSHTVVAGSEVACNDCHANALAQEYGSSGTMTLVQWNPSDSTFDAYSGTVPVPPDWATAFKLDFATRDTVISGPDTTVVWRYLKSGADSTQMLYASPLTAAQIDKLK